MPRFYFHLRAGDQLADDPEGSELANLEQARTYAINAAREIVGEAIKFGTKLDADAIVVADGAGQSLTVVSLAEVLPPELRRRP